MLAWAVLQLGQAALQVGPLLRDLRLWSLVGLLLQLSKTFYKLSRDITNGKNQSAAGGGSAGCDCSTGAFALAASGSQ